MNDREIKEILTTLELMAETENLIAELYKTYGETWKENEKFWFSISNDEKRHSEYIKKIAEIIEKRPENFQKYRPFNPTVVKTVQQGIINNIKRVKTKEISERYALGIAYDIEKSLIEMKYFEIVKTNDLEYKKLMESVIEDTKKHISKVESKLKNVSE